MSFSEKLDLWYTANGRTLPWRDITDPYRIWLSEIILQQTRIEQGRDYYLRFVEAYPTVQALAAAPDEQVMRLWQGLGYYSRCRNLIASARYIATELDGQFPSTYNDILKLKGVGRYTAAAIASFAFREPYPVIDGNVYRFISRLFGIATPIGTHAAYQQFESLLLRHIDPLRPDRFNAALMDFGSLLCKPHSPNCVQCPFAAVCVAFNHDKVDILPVKADKRKPTDRYFYYLYLSWNMADIPYTLIRQRMGNDIWKGLFEFPLIELDHAADEAELMSVVGSFLQDHFGVAEYTLRPPVCYKHQLTHRTIHAQFLAIELALQPPQIAQEYRVIPCCEIKKVPVSRLIDKYLRNM